MSEKTSSEEKTLSEEKRAELKELFKKKRQLDQMQAGLQREMLEFNKKLSDITGLKENINLNDLMDLIL